MWYRAKQEKATISSAWFCSIILDGADQSAFGLPRLVTKTKEVKGIALEVILIFLLDHVQPNQLHSYTMTEKHERRTNHVVEVTHRFWTLRNSERDWPSTIYVQPDNCTRENKKRCLFSFFQALDAWSIFDLNEVQFFYQLGTRTKT